MTPEDIKIKFDPIIEQVYEACALTDNFADREMFQIYIATIWGNTVLEPDQAGIEEDDLSVLHDYLNEVLSGVLGSNASITSCFEFIESKVGQESMERFQLTSKHRDFLNYFTNLILSTR